MSESRGKDAIPPLNQNVLRNLRALVLCAVILSTGIAATVLLGYGLPVNWIKNILPRLATMKFNTASSLLLCGIAMLMRMNQQKWLRRWTLAATAAAGMIAAVSLVEYFFKIDLRIVDAAPAGRMAPS